MSDIENNKQWVRIGSVGVDSGQLLVCDPCYLQRWEHDNPGGRDGNLGHLHDDGTILFCTLHGECHQEGAIGFDHFDQVIEKYGKSANQLAGDGVLKKVTRRPSGAFSYSGACQATTDKQQAGELGNGLGVAFSSGYGDGVYGVFARYKDDPDWGRRIAEVRIVLIGDND